MIKRVFLAYPIMIFRMRLIYYSKAGLFLYSERMEMNMILYLRGM